jgi:hypothetical protein
LENCIFCPPLICAFSRSQDEDGHRIWVPPQVVYIPLHLLK